MSGRLKSMVVAGVVVVMLWMRGDKDQRPVRQNIPF